jgi:hypothetical protein
MVDRDWRAALRVATAEALYELYGSGDRSSWLVKEVHKIAPKRVDEKIVAELDALIDHEIRPVLEPVIVSQDEWQAKKEREHREHSAEIERVVNGFLDARFGDDGR